MIHLITTDITSAASDCQTATSGSHRHVDLGPFTYSWTGPRNFTASTSSISGLIAGQYTVIITDRNGCPVTQTFNMREPGELGMTFDLSLSNDGMYNINCHGAHTGSITVIPVNNVGAVSYQLVRRRCWKPKE